MIFEQHLDRTVTDPELTISPVAIHVTDFTDESAQKFSKDLSKAHRTGQPIVPVIIDSNGGYISSFFAMYSSLQRAKLPVLTYARSRAYSAGFALLCSGTDGYRFVDPEASIMDHQVSTGGFGKLNEVKLRIEEEGRRAEHMYRVMDKECGKPEGFFESRFKKDNLDNWMSAGDAVDLGCADKVGRPKLELTVEPNWKLKR